MVVCFCDQLKMGYEVHLLSLPSLQIRTASFENGSEERVEDLAMAGIAFLVFFSNAMLPPLLPHLAEEFHATPMQLQWVVPVHSAVYGAATLAYGIVSDRFGRTPVLKRLLALACCAMLVLSLAASAEQLVVLRALSGAATGGIVTITLSIIGDRYPYAIQGRPMGQIFAAIVAGMGLGASLGPLASALIGWRNVLRLLALGFLFAARWVHQCYTMRPHLQPRCETLRLALDEYRCILKTTRGTRTLALILFNGFFHGGVFAWLGVFLSEHFRLTQTGIGIMLLGYGLPDLLIGRRIGGWADQFGRRYVVPTGFLVAGCGAVLFALANSRAIAAIAAVPLSLGFAATHPLMSSITTSLNPKHRGQITGMAGFVNFFGMAIGAVTFHQLLPLGFQATFLIFATVQLIAALAAAIGFSHEFPVPVV